MRDNFKLALEEVLRDEGGNVDDPHDHGGRTSRGIIQRVYDAWRREQGLPVRDVFIATQAEVEKIYLEEYWLPIGDLLPVPVDYLYFDMAVNGGPHRSAILLQRALGVTADGKIGPMTRQAIREADKRRLTLGFSEAKRAFYRSLHQPRFLKGWLNRTNHVENVALRMLANTK